MMIFKYLKFTFQNSAITTDESSVDNFKNIIQPLSIFFSLFQNQNDKPLELTNEQNTGNQRQLSYPNSNKQQLESLLRAPIFQKFNKANPHQSSNKSTMLTTNQDIQNQRTLMKFAQLISRPHSNNSSQDWLVNFLATLLKAIRNAPNSNSTNPLTHHRQDSLNRPYIQNNSEHAGGAAMGAGGGGGAIVQQAFSSGSNKALSSSQHGGFQYEDDLSQYERQKFSYYSGSKRNSLPKNKILDHRKIKPQSQDPYNESNKHYRYDTNQTKSENNFYYEDNPSEYYHQNINNKQPPPVNYRKFSDQFLSQKYNQQNNRQIPYQQKHNPGFYPSNPSSSILKRERGWSGQWRPNGLVNGRGNQYSTNLSAFKQYNSQAHNTSLLNSNSNKPSLLNSPSQTQRLFLMGQHDGQRLIDNSSDNLLATGNSPFYSNYFQNPAGGIGGSGSPFLGGSRPDSPALSNNQDYLPLQLHRKPSQTSNIFMNDGKEEFSFLHPQESYRDQIKPSESPSSSSSGKVLRKMSTAQNQGMIGKLLSQKKNSHLQFEQTPLNKK